MNRLICKLIESKYLPLSFEFLGRIAIFLSIVFLMQNTHDRFTEGTIRLFLLFWAMIPFMKIMNLRFPDTWGEDK